MRFRFLLVFMALLAGGCYRDSDSSSGASSPTSTASGEASSKGAPLPTVKGGDKGVAMSKDELSANAGIPIYPGAEVPEGKSSVTPTATETRYELNMVTSDSPEKVAEFYKQKLGVYKVGTAASIDMMGATSKGKVADIKIEIKDGKTHIQAVSLDEHK